MYVFGILSLVSGILLILLAFQSWVIFLVFFGLGLMAIWAAISYTSGNNPYGYAGLGDLSVFLFFGLLGVIGTFFLHTKSFDLLTLLVAGALGCFSTAVLNINNIRDIESDRKAGKMSIPVRIGKQAAIKYNWGLILSGYLMIIAFAFLSQQPYSLLVLISLPLAVKVGMGVQNAQSSAETDPYLKKMAMSTLLSVILFGIGLLF